VATAVLLSGIEPGAPTEVAVDADEAEEEELIELTGGVVELFAFVFDRIRLELEDDVDGG